MPARFLGSTVEELKSRRLTWAGQYQQSPAPLGGNLIKRSEVRYYGGIDPRTGQPDEKVPTNFDLKLISVECSFKDAAASDFVAIGVNGRKRYVLNVVNARLDAAATEAEIRRQRDVHPYIGTVLVEDKANGPAVIQRLKVNVPGVIEINPQGGKVAACSQGHPNGRRATGSWTATQPGRGTTPWTATLPTKSRLCILSRTCSGLNSRDL